LAQKERVVWSVSRVKAASKILALFPHFSPSWLLCEGVAVVLNTVSSGAPGMAESYLDALLSQ
jgi:hypothetical protein